MHARVIAVFLLIFTALMCPVPAAADDFAGAPDLTGFRGMKWGADVSGFKGLVLLNDDMFIQRYSRNNDQLTLGGIGLEHIIYNFYKGRFMGVSIQAQGAAEWQKIRNLMFEKFGAAPNISAHPAAEQYEWRSAHSTTHLQFFKSNRLVKLWIVSAEFAGLTDKRQ